MGHRLSAITTRTGDDGSTGLGDGTREGGLVITDSGELAGGTSRNGAVA